MIKLLLIPVGGAMRNRDTVVMDNSLVWVDGRLLEPTQATIPIMSAGAKYGANVFEGICVHRSKDSGQMVFRLQDHLARLHRSIKLMRIEPRYSDADFEAAIFEALAANQVDGDAHIRLSVIVIGDGSYDTVGPTSLACAVSERPPISLHDKTVKACVSSWRRIDDLTMPPRVKAGANYHNSRFALLEAKANGFDEALLLNASGKVSEATNSCFMMCRNGTLKTPPLTAGILESVTRDSFLRIAREILHMPVEVSDIDRTEVYLADEAFLCNSFEEVRPIREVDKLVIGRGEAGPFTSRLWAAYEEVVRGADSRFSEWLRPLSALYNTSGH